MNIGFERKDLGVNGKFIGDQKAPTAWLWSIDPHKVMKRDPEITRVDAKPNGDAIAYSKCGSSFPFRFKDDLMVAVYNDVQNGMPWVPDAFFQGVAFSTGYILWMQRIQLKRHVMWYLKNVWRGWDGRPMGYKGRVLFANKAAESFTRDVLKQHNINLDTFVPTETDNIICDDCEYARDFVRRYGRELKVSQR